MPRTKKKESAEADNITLSRIKNIQGQYTDSNLKEIVSNHLLTVNVTLTRQEWLWADTLHTSKLLKELGKKGLLKHLILKNGTGLPLKVVEFGCGARGPSLIMNLARLFPKFRYLGIDSDGHLLVDPRKEFKGSSSIFFENFNAGGALKMLRNGMRSALGWPDLAGLFIKNNMSEPDLIIFRHALIISAGEITSPYAYFAHLLTDRTPQLFNGASIIVTTYLDWEQDAAFRYLLVSFPYPNKIMTGTLQYPCHYHWRVIFGFIPRVTNLDQFYIGIPQYQYHESNLIDIGFYNYLTALPYILISQVACYKLQKYFPRIIYFPINFASIIFFLSYNINQDLSFGTATTELILISNFFSLFLYLGISYDLHKMSGQRAEPAFSLLAGLAAACVINRLLAAYVPSNLGYKSNPIKFQSNVSYAEQNQTNLAIENHLNETALILPSIQNLQCSSASRTLSPPFWLSLLWLPLAKLSTVFQGKSSSAETLRSLQTHKNTFHALEAKRIKPVLRKIQQYGYGHEPIALELSEMQHRIKRLLDEGANSKTVSKFLLDDIERFMGYLKTRLEKAESFLKSYRFFNLPKLNPDWFPKRSLPINNGDANFSQYEKLICEATQQQSTLSSSSQPFLN